MKSTFSDPKTDNMDLSDPILQVDESKIQREIIRVDKEWEKEDFENKDGHKYTKTISEALAIAAPETIIQIAAGNYSEPLVI